MWIILLDRSGSMGEPFSGNSQFSGRTKSTNAASKLEAAKQAVREHLAGLGTVSRVVLVAFNGAAEVVYDGPSNDDITIGAALDRLTADGSTDIARALHCASLVVQKAFEERTYRGLMVTDGKSDLAAAQDAATALARSGLILDVLLIDPTATGEAVARAIAVNGTVSAVASAAQLHEQVAAAKTAQENQRAEADDFVARHEEERARLATDKPTEERLAFTATYAPDVVPERWYPFTVYLHLAVLQSEVQRQIIDQVQTGAQLPFISVAQAGRAVSRGTSLVLTPRVDGLEFNPSSATIQWFEDIQDVRFRFRAASERAGTSIFGQLDIAVGSLPIAHLGITINVRTDETQIPRSPVKPVQANIYQDVFASYSSNDTAIVQACRAVYWGLGVHLTVDKQTLRAGQEWDPALREIINKCDLFQLFWSSNSSTSEPVRQEYQHALRQVPNKPAGFIRPVTWEEPHPRIPEELKAYHFTPLDLAAIARLSNIDLSAVAPKRFGHTPPPRGALLPVTVLPLAAGASPETVHSTREDVSEAVHFLEALTGLRYYPVPTLLVDEHVVKEVRAERTVDLAPIDPHFAGRASALQEVLAALCLEFHVRGFLPRGQSREFFDERFGSGHLMSQEQFHWLRHTCEWFPHFSDVIDPEWRKTMRAFGAISGQVQLDVGLRDFVQLVLDIVIDQLEKDNASELYIDQTRFLPDVTELPVALDTVFAKHGGRQDSTRNRYRLVGPPRAFAALLSALRERMQPLLSDVQALDCMQDEPRLPVGDELIQQGALAGLIARQVLPKKYQLLVKAPGDLSIDHWIREVLQPKWIRVAEAFTKNGLSGPDGVRSLPATLEVFLSAVQRALDEGLRAGDFPHSNSYCVSQDTWDIVRAEVGDHGLTLGVRKEYGGKLMFPLEGHFSSFVQFFRATSKRLLGLLSSVPRQRSIQQRVFVEMSPTFGIFAPARSQSTDHTLYRWAVEQGVSQPMTLPGADRVLLCLGASDRFRERLHSASDKAVEAERLAIQFQRCVLVHEHFHAIVEVGLRASGETAKGPSSAKNWRDALRLNEALATWAELHFVRGDETMEALVWDYIRAGSYPDWPYEGAARIDALYVSKGLDAVRQLIESLRQAPELAQQDFDRPLVN